METFELRTRGCHLYKLCLWVVGVSSVVVLLVLIGTGPCSVEGVVEGEAGLRSWSRSVGCGDCVRA